jgi:beta-phosphoglucomutase-like phosphatase (HAD superfamily)
LEKERKAKQSGPTVLFDLDGTLIDSVYQHILAWREALEQIGLQFSNASIHRRIGMSGNLILRSFMRETGRQLSAAEMERVNKLQSDGYLHRFSELHSLPGASDLVDSFEVIGPLCHRDQR